MKRIYREFLWGRNPQEIARGLEEDGVLGCNGQTKWYTSTVVGILKNEKHMGDALLQKTYTADFLTKRQVKNTGEITQVYVKDSHKGIIDKETWQAVQEEFERREKFMKQHGITKYVYGSECNPFTSRVFCGECGSVYTKHSWKSRGVEQWQCKNHRTNGRLTCKNAFVDVRDLQEGFVKAINQVIANKDKFQARWQQMITNGTALEKIRAKQLMSIVEEGEIQIFVPEFAQLVIVHIFVLDANIFQFEFMDANRIQVNV